MLATAGLLAFAWSTGRLMTLAQEFQDRHLQLFKQQHGPDDKSELHPQNHPPEHRQAGDWPNVSGPSSKVAARTSSKKS
jgi:hypothetical protein